MRKNAIASRTAVAACALLPARRRPKNTFARPYRVGSFLQRGAVGAHMSTQGQLPRSATLESATRNKSGSWKCAAGPKADLHMHARMQAPTSAGVHTHAHTHTTHVHTPTRAHIRTRTRTHARARVRTHAHTHTRTHAHTRALTAVTVWSPACAAHAVAMHALPHTSPHN
mmetsp:Transcript_16458/g.42150  ORF Transcript_16458/g.42150 Transcript_16458/m.42150 type:complete len:170 (+) Transcript_16458:642-1151(+)